MANYSTTPQPGIVRPAAAVLGLIVSLAGCSPRQQEPPGQQQVGQPRLSQFPSPMADTSRAHKRIANRELAGLAITLEHILTRPVHVFMPDHIKPVDSPDLLIHFHGAACVCEHAVFHSKHPLMLAVVNLGSGSSVYENAFQDAAAFPALVEAILQSVSDRRPVETKSPRIYLSSFSAGYGAIRAIIREHARQVDGIILLDGLHTDYVPPRRVLADGGRLNEAKLRDFVEFGRLAADNRKRLLITHSEIFPGAYASTTETADHIIAALGLQRQTVLRWGPVGMQIVSETCVNSLKIMGFAGNSAPDHIDHLHGLPAFLESMLEDAPAGVDERAAALRPRKRVVSDAPHPCRHGRQKDMAQLFGALAVEVLVGEVKLDPLEAFQTPLDLALAQRCDA